MSFSIHIEVKSFAKSPNLCRRQPKVLTHILHCCVRICLAQNIDMKWHEHYVTYKYTLTPNRIHRPCKVTGIWHWMNKSQNTGRKLHVEAPPKKRYYTHLYPVTVCPSWKLKFVPTWEYVGTSVNTDRFDCQVNGKRYIVSVMLPFRQARPTLPSLDGGNGSKKSCRETTCQSLKMKNQKSGK